MSLEDLLKRVESASGPDRNLDADLSLIAGWAELPGDNWLGPHGAIVVPNYTSSLDAALALVEEKLPGSIVTVTTTGLADILVAGKKWIKSPPLRTPALAVLSALLRALMFGGHDGR